MLSFDVHVMWYCDYSRDHKPGVPRCRIQYLHIEIARWGLRELTLRDYPHLWQPESSPSHAYVQCGFAAAAGGYGGATGEHHQISNRPPACAYPRARHIPSAFHLLTSLMLLLLDLLE